MTIKAIETLYRGHYFRSKAEARFAVFLDCLGVKWEYEPQGFDLGNGLKYLPDFKIYDVSTYHNSVRHLVLFMMKVILTNLT